MLSRTFALREGALQKLKMIFLSTPPARATLCSPDTAIGGATTEARSAPQRPAPPQTTKHLLLEHQLEVALVLAQVLLPLAELVLLQLERQLAVGLERRDVVLVLVKQVLDLLLVHLDLHLHVGGAQRTGW